MVPKHERLLLIDPADVLYFCVDHGVVRGHKIDDLVLVNYQLSDLEEELKEFGFFRAFRASLVNLRRVKEIQVSGRSVFTLVTDDTAATND